MVSNPAQENYMFLNTYKTKDTDLYNKIIKGN